MTTEQTYWTNTNGERHIATGDELKEILDAIAESEARIKAEEIERAEKAAAKAAILERLGITADEAALLLG
jgi:tRNA threonylcarbamoyladenosine modification (KEOPS) complex Cgi121 subunit